MLLDFICSELHPLLHVSAQLTSAGIAEHTEKVSATDSPSRRILFSHLYTPMFIQLSPSITKIAS